MTIKPGTCLGPYELTSLLGAGGMGEVYKAHDTKLGRDVAIKVLPEAFARDKERLARFEREARLLASLNHPNIATLFDLQEHEGTHFLVLELVPGETLADRIKSGAIPADDTLRLFIQIAEALEAAHEKGIIHRDLKPANIKVTPDGKAKVLDFGLAKAFVGEAPAQGLSESPTFTRDATGAGVLLGTAPYMSPEQARGKTVDKKTDVWAFGCCLYEALTGRAVFLGDTVSDTIARILEREPDWQALPGNTPGLARSLLRQCLHKDANHRLHDIADARIWLNEVLAEPLAPVDSAAVGPQTSGWKGATLWKVLAGLFALIAVAALWSARGTSSSTPRPITRFSINLPDGEVLAVAPRGRALALSPDGKRLAYLAERDGRRQLYLREMDALEPTAIPGTANAEVPFFSPDSQWLGFSADDKLKKVSIAGGAPLKLCDVGGGRGASWGPDDTIVFSPGETGGLYRVSASGGTPDLLTTPMPDKGEVGHLWPQILPGGRWVLFTTWTGSNVNDARIAVLSLDTGEWRTLVQGGGNAFHASTGHLVYGRAGSLMAAPFDLRRRDVTGPPVPLLDGIMINPRGGTQFDFSAEGSLVYALGGMPDSERTLVWVERNGETRPLSETLRAFQWPRLSPDGRRMAITIREPDPDIWVFELERGTLTRLTFAPGEDELSVWSPDGQRLAYASNSRGQLFLTAADSSTLEVSLTSREYHHHVTSWSPDGEALLFVERNPTTKGDIWVLPLEGEYNPRPFVQTPFVEWNAVFSPDGRWVAYDSDESGRTEIYVRPFPGSGAKVQVSTEGGRNPVWARSGQELFYQDGEKMMAVGVTTEPNFEVGKPRVLFERAFWELGGTNYDVALDDSGFVMIETGEQEAAPTQIHVVLNWHEELKRLVPTN